MIQTAQSSAGGSEFWCYLGVGLLVVGTLALLALLAIVGPIAKRLPWGKSQASGTFDLAAPNLCGDLLILLRRGAKQLAHILEHFPNWWPAIKDKNFKGKLPDGYGPTTHLEAMQTLQFMFGQFFSAAWTYQSFCLTHRDQGEVKAVVDEVYDALGKPVIRAI